LREPDFVKVAWALRVVPRGEHCCRVEFEIFPPSCESASSYESASQLRVFTYLWRAVCAAPLRFLLIALVRTAFDRHLARRVGGDDVGDAGGELACGR
jgi:hypothetical protein